MYRLRSDTTCDQVSSWLDRCKFAVLHTRIQQYSFWFRVLLKLLECATLFH